MLFFFPDSFTVKNGGPLILYTCFFYSVESNQVVSSNRFIFFCVFVIQNVTKSFKQKFVLILCLIILENGTKPYRGPYSAYSVIASFSTTNIIFCFVFLSFRRMEPGFLSKNMFLFFMCLSTIEPVVKEEICI